MSTRAELGALGERLAAEHLTAHGLSVLDRNWRCRDGELDIVARDGDALVFCEVKARRGTGYGTPAEAVTWRKQRRLRLLAQRWLAAHEEHAPNLRFDVVAVLLLPGRAPQLTHHPRAFE